MEEDFEKQLKEHLKNLEDFKQNTYSPITRNTEINFSATSKFGGFPHIGTEKEWAICPECRKPMQFFLQLNLEELPEKQGEGIFQLFYCLEDYLAKCRLVLKVEEKNDLQLKIDVSPYPQKEIVGWNVKDDFPHGEDYWNIDIEDIEDEVIMLMEEKGEGEPYLGDKLFGWSAWEQEASYPLDDKTNEEMKLFFQISSEENLPYMFGDDGKFYVFYICDDEWRFKTSEAGG